MNNATEWIAIGAVVTGATIFFSYLVYLRATALGHHPRGIWRALVIVWLCLVATIVVLAGARAILGGPIIEYAAHRGSFRLGGDRPESFYVIAAALVVVGLLLYVALRTVRQLQESPDDDAEPPYPPPSEEST